MEYKLKYLTEGKHGPRFFPYTHAHSVIMKGENTLQQELDNITSKIKDIPVQSNDNYKGKINIDDLLALPDESINPNDMYSVYASGNEEEGFSKYNFVYDGKSREPGVFIHRVGNKWEVHDNQNQQTGKTLIIDPPQDEIHLIYNSFSTYPQVRGAGIYGMPILKFKKYSYDSDKNAYTRIVANYANTLSDDWTLSIPYAKRTGPNSNYVYEGGLLDQDDYKYLREHDHGISEIINQLNEINQKLSILPDWNETDNTKISYIQNKPTILNSWKSTYNNNDLINAATIDLALKNKANIDASNVIDNANDWANLITGSSHVAEQVENISDGGMFVYRRTNSKAQGVNPLNLFNYIKNKLNDNYVQKSDIVNTWSNPHSMNQVPSESLVSYELEQKLNVSGNNGMQLTTFNLLNLLDQHPSGNILTDDSVIAVKYDYNAIAWNTYTIGELWNGYLSNKVETTVQNTIEENVGGNVSIRPITSPWMHNGDYYNSITYPVIIDESFKYSKQIIYYAVNPPNKAVGCPRIILIYDPDKIIINNKLSFELDFIHPMKGQTTTWTSSDQFLQGSEGSLNTTDVPDFPIQDGEPYGSGYLNSQIQFIAGGVSCMEGNATSILITSNFKDIKDIKLDNTKYDLFIQCIYNRNDYTQRGMKYSVVYNKKTNNWSVTYSKIPISNYEKYALLV